MAAGNVGYSDTRSFSGSLLGDIASSIRNRTKNAALMARQERAYAEEQAEKQDTSLEEAGIGKGYFFKRALGSNFGGDRIARTRGYFEKNPPMGRDPLGSIESRFRGGFDYGVENLEKPRVVTSKPSTGGTSTGGGTSQSSPIQKGSDDKKPLPVKHTRLTVGMLSTFQRLEKQLQNITDFVGTGSKDSQAIYALENQKMLLGSVFSKTTNMINAINKSIGSQTDTIKKIAKDEANKLKQDAIDAAAKTEESGSEGQNAKAGNAITKALNKAKQARSIMSAPGSRLKDIFGPASGMAKGLRNPRAAMRLARMRARRVFGKRLAKGVTGRAFGRVGKIIANKALKKTAAKVAVKGVGKMALKKVPVLGAVAGVAFGIERAMKGDWLGAIGEVASGTASIFPGVGTAVSAGIDAALMAKDVNEAMNQQETPAFADGGVIQGEDWFSSRISRFENDKLKREMGAKPLDLNFWREWHALEFKFDKKNRVEILDQIKDGLNHYFYQNGGVKAFTDGLKNVFDNIAKFLMNIPGNVGNFFKDRWSDLTSGLRTLTGLGNYRGPQMTATGGAKVTQANIARGFGVKDNLGSGKNPGGHSGIDISGTGFTQGTPVSFLPKGKVIDVGIMGDARDTSRKKDNGGYGNFVVIKTDTGEIVKMAHFDSVSVSRGDIVGKQDDGTATVVGKIGSTGLSTGPHLHLDLGTGYNPGTAYVSGLMDPMPYVNDLIRGGGDVKVTGQTARPRTTTASLPPQGSNDIIIPLDHVKPELSGKFPDDESRTSFSQSRATGAAGRERDHQDSAAAKLKTLLEKKGFRVSVIKPESFSSYETYDAYIRAEAAKGTRILPLHFDAKVGQGGTGFLTRTRKGDAADAAFARPIQAALANFQRANPELGNLGPTDTVNNATINAASASPAALIELGAMVQWEEKHGRNFTNTATFNTLIESVADAVAQGTPVQTSPIFTQRRQINTVPTTPQTPQQIWDTWLKGIN